MSQAKDTGIHGVQASSIRRNPLRGVACVTLITVAVLTTSLMAIRTRYRAHPDEYYHVDAFRFFEEHWWPPDLGSDDVLYSPQGWSWVYTGEVVYLLFGRISRAVQFFTSSGEWTFLIFRFSNIVLFLPTLISLFFTRSDWLDVQMLGLVFLCIPQVYYLYAYANSDAFGLSAGVFLFVLVAAMVDRPATSWRWMHYVGLGGLTGLVLASKTPYLVCLALPFVIIGWHLRRTFSAGLRGAHRRLAAGLLLALVLAATIAAPLKVVYRLQQASFSDRVVEMREELADEEFKPSNPTFETYRLASKGESCGDLLLKRSWLQTSLRSFYGLFGYMNIRNPGWIYTVAALGATIAIGLTVVDAVARWSRMPALLRIALSLSPVVFLVNTVASLVRSLYVGFQPQGRYLFPSLIPAALILTGSGLPSSRWEKLVRIGMFVVLYGICLYSLITVVALNPRLT